MEFLNLPFMKSGKELKWRSVTMVKEVVAAIDSTITESDDGKHRYATKRVWDAESPLVTVLTLYPTNYNYVENDLTNFLSPSNVYKLGYGGYYSTNLFSEKLVDKKKYKYMTDSVNDEIIVNSIKDSEFIILAYGSMPKKNKQVKERLEEQMDLLKKKRIDKKRRTLTDEGKENCYHPLSVKVRGQWVIM